MAIATATAKVSWASASVGALLLVDLAPVLSFCDSDFAVGPLGGSCQWSRIKS